MLLSPIPALKINIQKQVWNITKPVLWEYSVWRDPKTQNRVSGKAWS